jgi:hypothetical protein
MSTPFQRLARRAEACTHHALAEGRCCRVDRCDHGTVHLTVGTLTLRLSPDQLADLAATLECAAQRIDGAPGSRSERLLC